MALRAASLTGTSSLILDVREPRSSRHNPVAARCGSSPLRRSESCRSNSLPLIVNAAKPRRSDTRAVVAAVAAARVFCSSEPSSTNSRRRGPRVPPSATASSHHTGMPASKPPSKRSPPLHDSLATCQAVSSLRPAHEEKEEMDAVSANFRQPDGASVVPANGTSNGTASANGAATSGWSGEELIGYEGKGMQQRLRVAVDVDEGTERCYAGDLPPILTITARINATLSPPAHPPPPLPSPLSHPHPSPLPRPKPTSPFFSPSSRSPVLGSFLSTLNLFCAEKYSVRHDLHEFYVYDFMKVGNPFRRSESTGFAISWMRAQEFEPRLPPSQRVNSLGLLYTRLALLSCPLALIPLALLPSCPHPACSLALLPSPRLLSCPHPACSLALLPSPRLLSCPLALTLLALLPSCPHPACSLALLPSPRLLACPLATYPHCSLPTCLTGLPSLLSHCMCECRSRQHVIREPTLEWLDNHFPGVFSSVHFGNHFALEGTPRPKSEMCRTPWSAVCSPLPFHPLLIHAFPLFFSTHPSLSLSHHQRAGCGGADRRQPAVRHGVRRANLFSRCMSQCHPSFPPPARPSLPSTSELGAEVLIDDNPRYAMECAEHGIQVLLFDWLLQYPWSKTAGGGPHHELIERVRDWGEVEVAVRHMAVDRAMPWIKEERKNAHR
ncbi:unnamed protein product [Closterium sp. NIES-54]